MYFEESFHGKKKMLYVQAAPERPSGTETQGETTGGPVKTPATTHAHKTTRRN